MKKVKNAGLLIVFILFCLGINADEVKYPGPSIKGIEGKSIIAEIKGKKGSWKYLLAGNLIAEFNNSGVAGVWLHGGNVFSFDFLLTKADVKIRSGEKNMADLWNSANYAIAYKNIDPSVSCGDEAREMLVYGNIKGLDLTYKINAEEGGILNFDIEATPVDEDIKDFCWVINMGAYRATPVKIFLTTEINGKEKDISIREKNRETEISKWLRLTIAQNWKVDISLDSIGYAYVPELPDKLYIYPKGVKQGELLKKGQTYKMSFKTKSYAAPFYEGPIEVVQKNSSPLYRFPEPITLDININKELGGISTCISNALSEKQVKGDLLSAPETKGDKISYKWTFKPPEPGVYELIISAIDKDGREQKRVCELVSYGKIPQRKIKIDTPEEESFQLELVDKIDCTGADDKHPFTEGLTKSEIKESPAGKYREGGIKKMDYMIWEFNIKDLYQPHLVVVEYPDDKPRTISFVVTEPPNITRVCNGVVCGYPYPLANKMQKVSTIYYPTRTKAYFVICTIEDYHPAALKSVSVYKILDDIPEIDFKNRVPGRYIGVHTESENTQWVSYSSKLSRLWGRASTFELIDMKSNYFYRECYRTIANHIKDMHYSGQNLFVTGAYRYATGLFPNSTDMRSGFSNHLMDYFELMARMFEENDLNLILSVEFLSSPRLNISIKRYTKDEIFKGERSIVEMSRTGEISGGLFVPCLNPFAPEVQNAMVKVADEIATSYNKNKFPSMIGVAFMCGDEGFQPCIYRRFVPGENNYDLSYDDISIERFEKEKGLKIPVEKNDPQRFAKRYDWIMANAKKEWTQWRCEAMGELIKKIHGKVYAKGLDCYFLDVRSTMDSYSEKRWRTSGVSYRDMIRERGFDPEMLKGIKGLGYGNYYKQNEGRYYVQKGCGIIMPRVPTMGAIREFNMDREVRELYSNGENTACFIHSQFNEQYFPKGDKQVGHMQLIYKFQDLEIKSHWTGADYQWPTKPYLNDSFVAQLCAGDVPKVIMHTFSDNEAWVGSQDQIRKFALVYQTLPAGDYRILEGDNFDGNMIIREAKIGNSSYVCVINPCWWHAQCDISVSAPADIHDLVNDVVVKADKGKFTAALAPYELKTFKIAGNVSVVGNKTKIADPGIRELNDRLKMLNEKAVTDDAKEEIDRARKFIVEKKYYSALKCIDGYKIRYATKVDYDKDEKIPDDSVKKNRN